MVLDGPREGQVGQAFALEAKAETAGPDQEPECVEEPREKEYRQYVNRPRLTHDPGLAADMKQDEKAANDVADAKPVSDVRE